ncbi:pyrroline-5-carboxylate reductase 1, mitochondrial-like [Antedon mediterranea]|uniref:pyrroline-5-carboxylate reductase 1, mitochondrial-like n=1 Tax=Antedon mediterranea TaxID=105859 RepID=UPI003AF51546
MSLGFLGAGRIAQALAKGFISAGVMPAERMMASAPTERDLLEVKKIGLGITHENKEVMHSSDIIFLAVKPGVVSKVLTEIAPWVNSDHLVVSLAAGITVDFIEKKLPSTTKVIRAMPNTPCLVGAGATMFSCGTNVQDRDRAIVNTFFSSLGYCAEGDESLIDACMAISGSGPAFAFTAIDGLADGGVKMGLPRSLAITLAAQTLLGAAKMLLETKCHPCELKDDVCSPAGTTIESIYQLEKGGFRKCLIEAVEASYRRAKEIQSMQQG